MIFEGLYSLNDDCFTVPRFEQLKRKKFTWVVKATSKGYSRLIAGLCTDGNGSIDSDMLGEPDISDESEIELTEQMTFKQLSDFITPMIRVTVGDMYLVQHCNLAFYRKEL